MKSRNYFKFLFSLHFEFHWKISKRFVPIITLDVPVRNECLHSLVRNRVGVKDRPLNGNSFSGTHGRSRYKQFPLQFPVYLPNAMLWKLVRVIKKTNLTDFNLKLKKNQK